MTCNQQIIRQWFHSQTYPDPWSDCGNSGNAHFKASKHDCGNPTNDIMVAMPVFHAVFGFHTVIDNCFP